MMEILYTILAFLLVISIIVVTHELGHYIAARLFGVKVTDFAIGWGPKLFGIKDKAGTLWKFCAIPLGGYVKYYGDADMTSIGSSNREFSEKEKKYSFAAQADWKKIIMAAGGPLGNFFVAIFIFTYFFAVHGKTISENVITFVDPQGVAYRAGIQAGDKITKVEGSKISEFADLDRYVKASPNMPLRLEIERNGRVFKKTVTPEAVEVQNDIEKMSIGKIGVGSNKFRRETYSIPKAVMVSVDEVFKVSAFTLKALGQILTGDRGTKEMASVIRISKYSGKFIKQGFAAFMWFIAMLSINLGLINLLPISPLDGGHIFLYCIRIVAGEKIHNYIEPYATKIGIVILIAVMVFAIANDINYMK